MPKKSGKKGAKARPKPKGGRKSRGTKPRMQMSEAVMEKVCGLTDPFCWAAVTTRPGSSISAPTVPFQLRLTLAITNNSSGRGGVIVFPGLPYGYAAMKALYDSAMSFRSDTAFSAVDTAGTWTSITKSYRPRSAGIRVKRLVNDYAAQGIVVIAAVPVANVDTVYNMNNATTFARYERRTISELKQEISFVHQPTEMVAMFEGPNTTATSGPGTTNDSNWDALIVYVDSGRASQADIEIELFYNYEVQLAAGNTALESLASKAPPPSIVDTAVENVRRNIPPVLEGSSSVVGKQFKALANFALAKAMGAVVTGVATRYGGPAAGRAAAMAMIEDVD